MVTGRKDTSQFVIEKQLDNLMIIVTWLTTSSGIL